MTYSWVGSCMIPCFPLKCMWKQLSKHVKTNLQLLDVAWRTIDEYFLYITCMPINKWTWQRMLIWSILTFGSLRFECPLILFHRCLRWMSAHLMLNSVSDLWHLGLFYQGPADKNMKKTGGFLIEWLELCQRHEIWEPSQGDSIHVVDTWEFFFFRLAFATIPGQRLAFWERLQRKSHVGCAVFSG